MPATDRIPAQSQLGTVTIQGGLDALRRAAAATGELLGSISDSRADVPVPGLAWTVAETAAHLVALLRQSAAFASGARDGAAERAALPPSGGIGERMALANARELDRLGERRIPVLRQLLESSVDEYATLIAGRRDGGPVETMFGPEDPAAMTAALVGEQLVHGFDLARADRPALDDRPRRGPADAHRVGPLPAVHGGRRGHPPRPRAHRGADRSAARGSRWSSITAGPRSSRPTGAATAGSRPSPSRTCSPDTAG